MQNKGQQQNPRQKQQGENNCIGNNSGSDVQQQRLGGGGSEGSIRKILVHAHVVHNEVHGFHDRWCKCVRVWGGGGYISFLFFILGSYTCMPMHLCKHLHF
jgi:hypothetical protein